MIDYNADRVSTDLGSVYRLSVTHVSFAVASVSTFIYAASVIIVMSGPREVTIRFLNSILHGFDVTTIFIVTLVSNVLLMMVSSSRLSHFNGGVRHG